MKNSGVSLFGACWWAYAPFEALRVGTYLSIWVRNFRKLKLIMTNKNEKALRLGRWYLQSPYHTQLHA